MIQRLGMAVHLGMMGVALCALAFLAGGCAASGTIALGEHARAAISWPQPVCPGVARAEPVVGEKRTVTEAREGKLGPDNVTTTTTTEPAFAPQPGAVTLQEAEGAKISETAGGVFRTLFNVTKAAAIGLVKILFAPGT